MTAALPYAQTVQWIHRTKHVGGSSYSGNQWDESAPVDTPGVFAPSGSTELTGGRDTVISQPTLYGVDPTLAITAFDVMVVGGTRFEVDGDPAEYQPSPFTGTQVGQVVRLRKVTG